MKKGLHLLRDIPLHCLEQSVVSASRCPVSTSKSPWAVEEDRWVLWARKSLGDVFQLGVLFVFFFSPLIDL